MDATVNDPEQAVTDLLIEALEEPEPLVDELAARGFVRSELAPTVPTWRQIRIDAERRLAERLADEGAELGERPRPVLTLIQGGRDDEERGA